MGLGTLVVLLPTEVMIFLQNETFHKVKNIFNSTRGPSYILEMPQHLQTSENLEMITKLQTTRKSITLFPQN